MLQAATPRRDAAVTSRVSPVKRARVARVIPPGGIRHDPSHAPRAGPACRSRGRDGAAAVTDAGPGAGGRHVEGAGWQEGDQEARYEEARREAWGEAGSQGHGEEQALRR